MKAETAKRNPTVKAQAIKFYLSTHYKKGDIFTFMSLFNDAEPYPIDELIAVQRDFIQALNNAVHLRENLPSEFIPDMGEYNLQSMLEKVKSEQFTLKRLLAKFGGNDE